MFAKAAMNTAESGTYARQNRSLFFHTPTLDPRAMFHAASNPIGIAAIEAGAARLANRVKFVKNVSHSHSEQHAIPLANLRRIITWQGPASLHSQVPWPLKSGPPLKDMNDKIQDHPFLKEPPSALNALDASELPSFKHLPFMREHSLRLPPAAADIPHKHILILQHTEKASAFIERHAEMETHHEYITQFGFPKKEKYWGILSQKSRERIKDLAASEWACLRADNLFVTERDAMLDFLKKERKAASGSVRYPVRRSELHSSKRVERRSEMKRALVFMG
ncbi:hypothetical protein HDU77_003462 [Chytriomyces hyalinus]|nr:hypothetical protein HDU77_003462 [Chytriomyces hyalinus]